MKKLALLIVMMVIALTVYAEGGATVTVTGAIKAQLGMDIDNMTTGFKYVLDGLEVVMKPAVEASVAKKTGAEGETVYAEISMSGLRLEADSGYNGMTNYGSAALLAKWDALVAKVVLGPLTIMLKDGADTTINYEGGKADSFWLTNAYDYAIFSGAYGSADSAKSAALANSWEGWNQIQFATPGNFFAQTINYGVVAKFSIPSVADLALDIASANAWDDVANTNSYAGRVSAVVTAVPNLTLNAGANFAFGAAAGDMALGGKVGYTIAMGEGMSLTPAVAADVQLAVAPIISVTGGVKLVVAKSTITANVGYDMTASTLAYTIAAVIGAIDGLELKVAYEAIDPSITTAADDTMAIHGKLGYGIMIDKVTVTPSVQVSMDNKDDTTLARIATNNMYAKVALDITGLIPNAKLSLNWDSNNLSAATDTMGQVVFTTRVSF